MHLYFIRHGQSENNALWKMMGTSQYRSEDPPLTLLGKKQADAAGLFLSQLSTVEHTKNTIQENNITHLYTSLMIRAVETATVINQYLHLPLQAWEVIHECGGIYVDDATSAKPIGLAGKNRTFFETHFPKLYLPQHLNHQGWWNRPYEETHQVIDRAKRFVTDLLKRHGNTDDCVAIISHGDFYQRVMAVLLRATAYNRDFSEMTTLSNHLQEEPIEGLPPHYWFIINNAAISRVDFHGDYIEFVYLNRTDFMPKTLIT